VLDLSKFTYVLLAVPCVFSCRLTAQSTAPAAAQSQATLVGKASQLLRDGTKEKGTEHRAAAVRALSLIQGEKWAVALATGALTDSKPEVRKAGATALGEMHATSSIPNLKEALSDRDLTVVLAAAHSLLILKDKSPYDVYYAILTGDRKGGGLISDQLAVLRDPKKMALLGFREGLGYVPFGDMGYTAMRAVTQDSSAPVRAAAARMLADDPDPVTQNMLAQEVVSDKSELVRIGALEAIAKRDDPAAIEKIAAALNDPKYAVRYAAAATILRLNGISRRKKNIRK
jgi:HEAT repeat protein